ncbi:MAG: T9SS type A sorting domain-containing protein [Ignavibacteria bacterium]|nr:T9SS type A sorting domain-containing protein [Ignavibacteria bacterium]
MKKKILPLLLTVVTLLGFSQKTFSQITSTLAGGGWSDTLTWIGHKMPTQNDDVIIQGPVHPGGGWAFTGNWPKCKNLYIENTGMLTASNLYVEVFDSLHNKGLIFQSSLNAGSIIVRGSFLNEGEVSGIVDGYGGLTFELGKHLTNNGKFKVEMLSLSDSTLHIFSATDTIETTDMVGTDSTSTLFLTSNVIFKNAWIKLGKASVVLTENITWETWNTIVENGKIFANNSTIRINNGRFLDIHDAKIKYFYTQWGDVDFHGTTTVTGELYGGPNSDWRVLYIFYGDLLNYGIISSDYLTLEFKKNFHNESETKAELVFSGTGDQAFSFADTAKFTSYKTIKLAAEKTGTTYQWYRNDISISSANSFQYQITQENVVANTNKQGAYTCAIDGVISPRKIIVGGKLPSGFEIYDVLIKGITTTSVSVSWKTTIPARGFVFYVVNDTTNGYPLEAMEAHEFVLYHSLVLDNLTIGAKYYFIISQYDQAMNEIRTFSYSFIAGAVGISDIEYVNSFALHQNYPNPFNPVTKIKYSVETRRGVSLCVYDVLGNEVATLVNEEKNSGTYEVEFQSVVGNRQLASGVYFYQLRAGNFVQTKKFVLLK